VSYVSPTCGANRAKALKEPEKSIPHGTLAAITISLVMYTSYMIMWGAVADREYLKAGAYHLLTIVRTFTPRLSCLM
jgi:amino acid transporter